MLKGCVLLVCCVAFPFLHRHSLHRLTLSTPLPPPPTKAAGELYGYGHFDKVIFKPTKAAAYPFRPTAGEAMSYFVGGSNVPGGYDEDKGFAINGGKGWSKVVFNNHDVVLDGSSAVAMGEYLFTCATTGEVSKVEYTFGYRAIPDGTVRIWLHHSSVPYQA